MGRLRCEELSDTERVRVRVIEGEWELQCCEEEESENVVFFFSFLSFLSFFLFLSFFFLFFFIFLGVCLDVGEIDEDEKVFTSYYFFKVCIVFLRSLVFPYVFFRKLKRESKSVF